MITRDPNCKLCRLSATAKTVCLLGNGPKRTDVMIIGEAPGASEDETGKPFVGKSGQLLSSLLEEAGIVREATYIANAVSCRPPDNKTPTKSQIKSCKIWLDRQIQSVKPKFILLLGNTPLQSVTGKPGIKKVRGRPFIKDDIIYLPTFHPAAALRDPALMEVIKADLILFEDIIDRGEIPREKRVNYEIIKGEAQLDKLIADLEGWVSLDIETTGLYAWHKEAKVISIGFGLKKKQYILPIFHPQSPFSPEAIKHFIKKLDIKIKKGGVKFIAHNGKFDFVWLWVHFGVKWYQYFEFDTMLAHYLLDENDQHGLKYLAQKVFQAPNWDVDKDEKTGAGDLEDHALYLAHDVYYTRRLRTELLKWFKEGEEGPHAVFKHILMPCARMFVEVEYDGVYIKADRFDQAEEYLRKEYNDALQGLEQWGEINWGSPQQLAKKLFDDLGIEVIEKTPTGNPSTSESVLKRIDHPCVGDLLKFRAAKQQLSFFIDGWQPFLDEDGYLHPVFKLHGTVTGRLSAEHPNLQQVPRDPRIRSLISAPEGWTLLEADLSQIELRIAAELAGEKTMLDAFNRGVDTHWLTAISEIERGGGLVDLVLDTARTWKQDKKLKYAEAIEVLLEMGPDAAAEINPQWKEFRKRAKAINFGYLYGMWWKKFKLYARDNYGVIVDDDQAQASRKTFFSKYSGFLSWHKRQNKLAQRYGYVPSLSGRKRRLPKAMGNADTPERREALRQAINSPVQSFANEINLMAALQLRSEFDRSKVRICGTVHDAILVRVKDEYLEQVGLRLLEIMTGPELFKTLDIQLSVPILAEAKVGDWGIGIDFHKWQKGQKNGKVKRSV